MSGSTSRTKGHKYERKIAQRLKEFWPEAKRGYQTRDGSDAPDVDGTMYWVECKIGGAPNVFNAMTQAEKATDGRPCIAVCYRNKKGSRPPSELVAMRWETFVELATYVKDSDNS